jgi:hypothetical protein
MLITHPLAVLMMLQTARPSPSDYFNKQRQWCLHLILVSDVIVCSKIAYNTELTLLGAEPFCSSRSVYKNLPVFRGIRRFITVITEAFHWTLSRARSIQSIPFSKIYSNIILRLRLGLPSGLLSSDFPTNNL